MMFYLHGSQVMKDPNFWVAIFVLILEWSEPQEWIFVVDEGAEKVLVQVGRSNLEIWSKAAFK